MGALPTSRFYGSALPLDEAMDRVAQQAGKGYDPKVVAMLQKHYVELEEIASSKSGNVDRQKLSTDLKVERGAAPAAGFAVDKTQESASETTFLTSIPATPAEIQ